jgi:hypothetical protein
MAWTADPQLTLRSLAANRLVYGLHQADFVTDPGHDAEVIDAFGFKTRLGAHAPSLPNIFKIR